VAMMVKYSPQQTNAILDIIKKLPKLTRVLSKNTGNKWNLTEHYFLSDGDELHFSVLAG
jgi:hypothetical protein